MLFIVSLKCKYVKEACDKGNILVMLLLLLLIRDSCWDRFRKHTRYSTYLHLIWTPTTPVIITLLQMCVVCQMMRSFARFLADEPSNQAVTVGTHL